MSANPNNRFEIISTERMGQGFDINSSTYVKIYRDKLTGVLYLETSTYHGGGGLTPLLDKDGKPTLI